MLKYLMAVAAACLAATASAQTKPPDVPDYIPVAATYPTNGSVPIIGDNTTPRGGTMPVIAKQLPDIPSTATSWLKAGANFTGCVGGGECKFRAVANISHLAFDDPVRNYGQPGASHCHEFFGSTSTNAFTTYASLRTRANAAAASGRPASTFAGGPYNATGYWFPCVIMTNPFSNGKSYAVKPFQMIVYYSQDPAAGTAFLQRIPRGARYVAGVNMDDPDDCGAKNEVSLANGGSGTACTDTGPNNAGWQYRNNGFIGWKCVTLPDASTVIQTSAGTDQSQSTATLAGGDPWGGACTAGNALVATVNGPKCYDGVNLWSPGGYKHFRREIINGNTGKTACPSGWYQVPELTIGFYFKHQGFADYSRWRLASDDMAATVSGHPWANGSSFHTDWFGGWDDTVFFGSADGSVQGWQKFCLGAADGTTPHLCNSSTFNGTSYLLGGNSNENAPDGSRVPQVNLDQSQYSTSSATGMFAVPVNKGAGPVTINAIPK